MRRPEIPALEVVAHMRRIPIIPHMSQVLLDCPGSAYLEVLGAQQLKLLLPPERNVLLAPQPQVLGALQCLFATLPER